MLGIRVGGMVGESVVAISLGLVEGSSLCCSATDCLVGAATWAWKAPGGGDAGNGTGINCCVGCLPTIGSVVSVSSVSGLVSLRAGIEL